MPNASNPPPRTGPPREIPGAELSRAAPAAHVSPLAATTVATRTPTGAASEVPPVPPLKLPAKMNHDHVSERPPLVTRKEGAAPTSGVLAGAFKDEHATRSDVSRHSGGRKTQKDNAAPVDTNVSILTNAAPAIRTRGPCPGMPMTPEQMVGKTSPIDDDVLGKGVEQQRTISRPKPLSDIGGDPCGFAGSVATGQVRDPDILLVPIATNIPEWAALTEIQETPTTGYLQQKEWVPQTEKQNPTAGYIQQEKSLAHIGVQNFFETGVVQQQELVRTIGTQNAWPREPVQGQEWVAPVVMYEAPENSHLQQPAQTFNSTCPGIMNQVMGLRNQPPDSTSGQEPWIQPLYSVRQIPVSAKQANEHQCGYCIGQTPHPYVPQLPYMLSQEAYVGPDFPIVNGAGPHSKDKKKKKRKTSATEKSQQRARKNVKDESQQTQWELRSREQQTEPELPTANPADVIRVEIVDVTPGYGHMSPACAGHLSPDLMMQGSAEFENRNHETDTCPAHGYVFPQCAGQLGEDWAEKQHAEFQVAAPPTATTKSAAPTIEKPTATKGGAKENVLKKYKMPKMPVGKNAAMAVVMAAVVAVFLVLFLLAFLVRSTSSAPSHLGANFASTTSERGLRRRPAKNVKLSRIILNEKAYWNL
ncbi:uncharacterized protein LOC135399643 isoform X2 [Ornithodoros turicata]|uniref:uncharacterized protein LOC135399643 isoform X2 n=1 Tax=Ornithodoros turicata TaxID=34597 RepID=UPI00313A0B44